MYQHSTRDTRRADGRGDGAMRRGAALILAAALLAGCVHKAPGLPAGRPAPVVNTDRPGTLTR